MWWWMRCAYPPYGWSRVKVAIPDIFEMLKAVVEADNR
jgi:hypothetical protein